LQASVSVLRGRQGALALGRTVDEVKAEGAPDWLVPRREFER
jgi:hypothetical protein